MSKSTARRKAAKVPKDFPLWKHPSGRWCRKIKGKWHYFGKTANDPDGDAALAEWNRTKDDLLAGRTPRPSGEGLTLASLCNHFLTFKLRLLESGELAQRTLDRYKATTDFLIETFGKGASVDTFRPADFETLRARMAKRWGAVALANEIQIVRSVFRYGVEAELIDRAIRFGPGFKKPSAKTIRQTRAAHGPRDLAPDEIHALLAKAGLNMKAMILLAINGGLGNTDIGLLPKGAVDLKGGWLDHPRPKTGMPRRIPLWPETVAAIRRVLAARHEPTDPANADLLFIGPRGQDYVGRHKGYRVTQEFSRVAKTAKVDGRSFYDLRRTFETIGGASRDQVAVDAIMGHAPPSGDMAAIYRQRVDDDRLRAVVNHVHAWLFQVKKKR